MRRDRQNGQGLPELVIALAIVGCVTFVGIPSLTRMRDGVALAGAIAELRAVFHHARMKAIVHNRNVAIRFRLLADRWWWTVYEDGDGDGVRNDDITKGIDPAIEPPRILQSAPARIGVPDQIIPDPANGKPLQARPPVRFGNSYLCSFSRDGEGTNGSLVVTDGRNVRILQVHGHSAHVTVQRWNGKKWLSGS